MKKVLLLIAGSCLMSIGAFAQCTAFPCVVASASFTKQNHGLARTTLFTPPSDGMFRINAYLSVTKPTTPTNAGWDVFFNWNDGIRANHWVTNAEAVIPTNAGIATILVHAIAGQPIEYRTATERWP